jgi:glycosyltransferase involved in cell wall biosynthesis
MQNTKSPFISVVTPVYGCRASLYELYIRLKETLEKINPDFEIIMVNDGSPDNAWETIIELAAKDKRVKGINLSRNFGQHYAITAGLDYCKGEWIVVMDCDLQDQPEEILKLYNKALEGWDIVFARRNIRKDSFFKQKSSALFYNLFSYLTDSEQDSSIANFGIFHYLVIDSIKSLGDYFRVFPILAQWVGFNKVSIDVIHSKRLHGKSSYNKIKLLSLAFDMVISFSDKPLKLGMKIGVGISIFSLILMIYYLVKFFSGAILVPGYASIVVLITFFSGAIITFIGLLGHYIGKVHLQVKQRPKYIIRTMTNI